MACKIEGCNSSKYHYNPLITPLKNFHGRVVKAWDNLLKDGLGEVVKRIGTFVIALIAYPGLGLVALGGLVSNKFWLTKHPQVIDSAKKHIEVGQGYEGMVKALGGKEVCDDLPEINHWRSGEMKLDELQTSVMKGSHRDDSSFFVFSYFKRELNDDDMELLKRSGEYIGYSAVKEGGDFVEVEDECEYVWQGNVNGYQSELNFRAQQDIPVGSFLEKCMLDRIKRLMQGEPVGRLKEYPGLLICIGKPDNKDDFRPTDSYLKGEELEIFMDEDCEYYEVEVEEGATDLFLYDPNKTEEENKLALLEKFPNTLS